MYVEKASSINVHNVLITEKGNKEVGLLASLMNRGVHITSFLFPLENKRKQNLAFKEEYLAFLQNELSVFYSYTIHVAFKERKRKKGKSNLNLLSWK